MKLRFILCEPEKCPPQEKNRFYLIVVNKYKHKFVDSQLLQQKRCAMCSETILLVEISDLLRHFPDVATQLVVPAGSVGNHIKTQRNI